MATETRSRAPLRQRSALSDLDRDRGVDAAVDGRGPLKARTTVRDTVALAMLEQTLTKGEQVLVENGRGKSVLGVTPRIPGCDAR